MNAHFKDTRVLASTDNFVLFSSDTVDWTRGSMVVDIAAL